MKHSYIPSMFLEKFFFLHECYTYTRSETLLSETYSLIWHWHRWLVKNKASSDAVVPFLAHLNVASLVYYIIYFVLRKTAILAVNNHLGARGWRCSSSIQTIVLGAAKKKEGKAEDRQPVHLETVASTDLLRIAGFRVPGPFFTSPYNTNSVLFPISLQSIMIWGLSKRTAVVAVLSTIAISLIFLVSISTYHGNGLSSKYSLSASGERASSKGSFTTISTCVADTSQKISLSRDQWSKCLEPGPESTYYLSIVIVTRMDDYAG